jgi:glucose 1-dehydrogenase
VAVNYVDGAAAAQEVVNSIGASGGRAMAIKADVSSETDVQAMFRQMIQEFGTIDILINNAGLQRDAPFDQMTLAQWNFVIGVNLTGQFLCAREALREFKRRGVVKEVSVAAGKIICISSVHEVIPWSTHANYAASKGGIMMMMRSLAPVGAYPVSAHRRTRGRRPGGRHARERPVRLHHRREHFRGRRHDAVSGVLHRRLKRLS